MTIPHLIHGCWLGGEKTALAKKCRASWETFARDWTIREWTSLPDETPAFVREAVRRKQWAFASDWMRFWVLAREGGVYFDYDVELIAPFDGLIDEPWCATERMMDGREMLNPGAGLALPPASDIARDMLAYYETATYSEETVGSLLERIAGTRLRRIPVDVLSPCDGSGTLHLTPQTRAIHHYALSWASPARRLARWLNWHHLGFLARLGVRLKHRIRKRT